MLESLRNMMGGVVAKILIGLLVISFAVWGASDAFISGGGTNTVVVGDTKVGLGEYRLAYVSRVNAIQRQLNQRLSREQLQALGVEQAVLSQVVSGAVLDETARKMGLGISDEGLAAMIGNDESFQDATGRFSRQNLEFALRQVGMTEDDYIESRRSAAVRDQLLSGVAEDVAMPDAFFDAYHAYENQRRAFRYVVVRPEHVDEPATPGEAQLREFFETNAISYRAPEFRRLVVVGLTPEDIADPDAISREDAEAEYERTKQAYTTEEKRRVEQLNFPTTGEAEAALERITKGESFDTIMIELGRSAEDVDLGLLEKDDIPDQNIANAAFALEEGATSGIVDGIFGPVILRVSQIQEGQSRPFAEVEQEVREALALERAADEIFDTHDRLEDERAAGDPLSDAARKVGLTARIIEAVDQSGQDPDGNEIEGVPEFQSVLTEAFQTDEGVEADPVGLGTSGFVWYEVLGITEERQRDLSEVRADVEEAWKNEQASQAVSSLAETIRERVEKGESFDDVVAEAVRAADGTDSVRPESGVLMTRNETSQNLTRDAVAAGFSIAKDAIAVAPGPTAQSRVVLQVTDVVESDRSDPPQAISDQVNAALGNDLATALISDLQSREAVSINSQAIETAITY